LPTINQLVRFGRAKVKVKSKSPALDNCPFKRGVCTRVYTTNPKKPNSAMRKVARVRPVQWDGGNRLYPRKGHSLQEHSIVLGARGKSKRPSVLGITLCVE